ncbi:MAG: hypothetical protein ACOYNL_10535, partial [Rickettsiales bacterium]
TDGPDDQNKRKVEEVSKRRPGDPNKGDEPIRTQWSDSIGNPSIAGPMSVALARFSQQMQSADAYNGRAIIALDMDFSNGEQPSVMPSIPYQPAVKAAAGPKAKNDLPSEPEISAKSDKVNDVYEPQITSPGENLPSPPRFNPEPQTGTVLLR